MKGYTIERDVIKGAVWLQTSKKGDYINWAIQLSDMYKGYRGFLEGRTYYEDHGYQFGYAVNCKKVSHIMDLIDK